MNRRLVAFAAAFVCLTALPAAAQDFSGVEMKAAHVAGAVHMLEGAGGHIGVSVGPDGILIVDDQFAPLADKIRAALGKIGDGKPRFILNTHWHGDHTGANPVFGPEGTIIAHDNVRARLAAPRTSPLGDEEPMAAEGLPVITFDRGLKVHFNGEEIRVIHFPHAHTDGDSVVVFTGSNVVHMGDLLFSGWFPYVDLDSGGNVQGLIDAIGQVLDWIPADARIIGGHGPLTDVAGLREYHAMLVETTDIVRGKMKAGKDLASIQEEGLPEKWAGWSWRFIDTNRWLEIVFNSYSQTD